MREQKEFAVLLNKIKTQGTSQSKAFSSSQPTSIPQLGLEDTLKECYQLLGGHKNTSGQQQQFKASHPVFVELERHIKGEQNASESNIESIRPWSEKNRDKLKVL